MHLLAPQVVRASRLIELVLKPGQWVVLAKWAGARLRALGAQKPVVDTGLVEPMCARQPAQSLPISNGCRQMRHNTSTPPSRLLSAPAWLLLLLLPASGGGPSHSLVGSARSAATACRSRSTSVRPPWAAKARCGGKSGCGEG